MGYFILFFILTSFATSSMIATKSSVCFYANWAQFRKGNARFLPKDIDVNLCSHITYAHLKINLVTHRLVQRQKNDHLLLDDLVSLKKIKPSLKIIISVGKVNIFITVDSL